MKKHRRETIAICLLAFLLVGFAVGRSSASHSHGRKREPQASRPFVLGRVLVQFCSEPLLIRTVKVNMEATNDDGEIGAVPDPSKGKGTSCGPSVSRTSICHTLVFIGPPSSIDAPKSKLQELSARIDEYKEFLIRVTIAIGYLFFCPRIIWNEVRNLLREVKRTRARKKRQSKDRERVLIAGCRSPRSHHS